MVSFRQTAPCIIANIYDGAVIFVRRQQVVLKNSLAVVVLISASMGEHGRGLLKGGEGFLDI